MEFALNKDQAALADALDKLASRFEEKPTDFHGFALESHKLESALEEGQYFDIARVDELGSVSAALAVERLARLPCTAEVAVSMLVRGQVDAELPRPCAFVEGTRPSRFAANAKSLLIADGEHISVARPDENHVMPVESIYAYPMGRLTGKPSREQLSHEVAAKVRTWLRIACAAEMAGLLQATIDSTALHLKVRQQFGRPLGTFQGLRHRIAECAVLTGGVRWLMLKAAATGSHGDAALALLHAQDTATRVIYDVHQMFGAMGMTLELSLHLWTFRMKALLSELGGREGQAAAVAHHCFAENEAEDSLRASQLMEDV